jgi:hypothetical protein
MFELCALTAAATALGVDVMTRPDADLLKVLTGGGVSSPESGVTTRLLEEMVMVDRV